MIIDIFLQSNLSYYSYEDPLWYLKLCLTSRKEDEDMNEGEQIATLDLYQVDARYYSSSEIRRFADSIHYSLYETLSSVRIYPFEYMAKEDADDDFRFHDKDVFAHMPIGNDKSDIGYLEMENVSNPVESVWENLMVIDSTNSLGELNPDSVCEIFTTLLKYIERLGVKFLILPVRYFINQQMLKKLKRLGFRSTYGRAGTEHLVYCIDII